MRFELLQRVRATLAEVEAALVEPAFIAALGQMPALGSPELLDQREHDHLVERRIRYAFVGHLSPAVTAVVDPRRLTWVEEATIDRTTHRSEFRIVPDHYANLLAAAGTIALSADDGVVVRRAEGELHVHVPLLGRKVETAIIGGLHEHAEAEARALQGWIDGRH